MKDRKNPAALLEDEELLRDGQRLRISLMMRDSEQSLPRIADAQRAFDRGTSVWQAQYENRVIDAWKQPDVEMPVAPTPIADSQSEYETRIANAWKDGANA